MTISYQADNQSRATPRWMLWTGWIISAVPALFMAAGGIFFYLFKLDMVAKGMADLGYPTRVAPYIIATEVGCAILYALPQTAVLGAILLTGYLGGATASHVRAEQPFFGPILFGVLVWLGLFFRDARIRTLVPFRKRGQTAEMPTLSL